MTSIEDIKQPEISSLESLITQTIQKELNVFFKRRLVFWAMRWSIIFLLVALIVNAYSKIYWLWWVAIAAAGVSLITSIMKNIATIRNDKKSICLESYNDD